MNSGFALSSSKLLRAAFVSTIALFAISQATQGCTGGDEFSSENSGGSQSGGKGGTAGDSSSSGGTAASDAQTGGAGGGGGNPNGKDDGEPCADGNECTSGYCVDDFCCENECAGVC